MKRMFQRRVTGLVLPAARDPFTMKPMASTPEGGSK